MSIKQSNIDHFSTSDSYEAYSPEYVEGKFADVRVQGSRIAEARIWTEDAPLGAARGRVRYIEYSDRGTLSRG